MAEVIHTPFYATLIATGAKDRFWPKVAIGAPDECWLWLASTSRDQYGRFKVGRYSAPSNRVAWALHNGRDPGPLVIRHTCDNPPCCNPGHLVSGTHLDNARDKVERGRCRGGDQRGSSNGNARLSEAQVGEIVRAFRKGENNCSIAARYAVTHGLVSRIRTGRAWRREAIAFGWTPVPGQPRLTPAAKQGGSDE